MLSLSYFIDRIVRLLISIDSGVEIRVMESVFNLWFLSMSNEIYGSPFSWRKRSRKGMIFTYDIESLII